MKWTCLELKAESVDGAAVILSSSVPTQIFSCPYGDLGCAFFQGLHDGLGTTVNLINLRSGRLMASSSKLIVDII